MELETVEKVLNKLLKDVIDIITSIILTSHMIFMKYIFFAVSYKKPSVM